MKKTIEERQKALIQARSERLTTWMKLMSTRHPKFVPEKTFDKTETKNSYLMCFADMQENGTNWTMPTFQKIFQQAKEYLEKHPEITHLTIFDGGDGIDGNLRLADLYYNLGTSIKQVLIYQDGLVWLLSELAKLVRFDFYSVLSNHTQIRAVGSKRDLMPEDDFAFLFQKTLTQYFAKSSAHIIHPVREEHYLKINTKKILFLHGHQLTSTTKHENFFHRSNSYYKNIDYLIHGHFHHLRITHINRKVKHNKLAISLPCLDPRENKRNEKIARYSNYPSWVLFTIEKTYGLTNFQLFPI